MLLLTSNSLAGDWKFFPRLEVGTILTDNVDQSPADQAKSDIVLEVVPGFSASRQGGRLRTNVDYTLQGLTSLLGSRDDYNQNLRGIASAELYPDRLFLNTNVAIRRVISSANGNTRLGGENSIYGGNTTQAATYNLNPYLINQFGGYAQSRVSYNYGNVLFGNNANASDGERHDFNIDLSSGRYFVQSDWQLNYTDRILSRSTNGNNDNNDNVNQGDRVQEINGKFDYALNREWQLLSRAGYSISDVQGIDSNNGFYAEAGIGWTPSRYLATTALYGINAYEFSVTLRPTMRTELEVNWQKRDIGLEPGQRWSGTLRHRTRFSTWSASYTEQVTNVQQTLLDQPLFDEQGNVIQQQQLPFNLNNGNYLLKAFRTSVSYNRGRSQVTLYASDERREYDNSVNNEHSYGTGLSLSRRLAPRTVALLTVDWERTDSNSESDTVDRWQTQLGLNHQFSTDLSGSLDYNYFQGNPNQFTNNDGGNNNNNSYRENRVNLRLLMKF